MIAKNLTLTVALIASLAGFSAAQKSLDLSVDGANGFAGLWAEVKAENEFTLRVGAIGRDCKVYIVMSPITVLGELDIKNAQLIAQDKMFGKDDFTAQYQLPKEALDLPGVSVVAATQDHDGNWRISPVLTLVFHKSPAPTKPAPTKPQPTKPSKK